MSQIASLFARLGFDVDSKGLKEFENKLNQATKKTKAQGEAATKAGAATDKATNKSRKSQNKLAKEIRSNYAKVRTDRKQALIDLQRIKSELSGAKLKSNQRLELLEAKGRTQQRLDDLVKQERIAQERLHRQAAASAKKIEDAKIRETKKRIAEQSRLEKQAQRERMRESSRYGRSRRGGMSYRGAREYGRAWIPGLGGAFAATQATRSYQDYVGTQAGLTAATGSEEQAGKEFKFLEELSKKLGVYVGDMAKSFTSLSANTRNTSLEGKGTRDVFEAVSSYSRVLNLSAADQNGVFRALTQMVGKGQVYAEELRQQMGERLPGSFQAMARASGFGDDEAGITAFYKAVEAGEIKATEVFPKFSEELMKMANEGGALEKAMNNTAASIGRFRTNVYLANKTFNESGYDKAVRDFFNQSSTSIDRAEPLWEALGKAAIYAGTALEVPVELFGALAQQLPALNNLVSNNAVEFGILGAAILSVVSPLRKLALFAFVLPLGLMAISDLLLDFNRDRTWEEWAVQIGLAATAAGLLLGKMKGLHKLGKGAKGLMTGGSAAASGGIGAASMASIIAKGALRVTVVGFAASVLAELTRSLFGDTEKSYSENIRNFGDWAVERNNRLLNREPSAGLERGGLNDSNLDAYLSSMSFKQSTGIRKPEASTQFIGDVHITVESPDPELAGIKVEEAYRNLFSRDLRIASSSEQVTEK